MIMYGIGPNFPIDHKFNKKPVTGDIIQHRAKRDSCFDKYAKTEIEKGKIMDKRVFEEGDEVMLYNKAGQTKLEQHWFEGYKISRKLNQSSYMVEKDGKQYR
ncbi:hypothetical protein COBT_004097, partial [Conglomerata obtusa]